MLAAVAPAPVKEADIEDDMVDSGKGANKVSPSVPVKGELIGLAFVLELGLDFVDKSESNRGTFWSACVRNVYSK
jgi:hypothetical protein